jgi:chaperonin GroES
MPNFKPLNDHVLVQPPDPSKVSPGGIILPDSAAQDKPQQGRVVAVGPGRMLESGDIIPMSVKKDDNVLFGAYAGIEMKIGNQTFLVIRQEDILLAEVREEADAQDADG